MYRSAGGGPGGWLWRLPLFCALLALLLAIILLFMGRGLLIGTREPGPGLLGCRYLTLRGVTEAEVVGWQECSFIGQPGKMEGRQPVPFLV